MRAESFRCLLAAPEKVFIFSKQILPCYAHTHASESAYILQSEGGREGEMERERKRNTRDREKTGERGRGRGRERHRQGE